MLDLHKLNIFAAVARTGSFSAAAEQLLLSQPAVSQHVHDLEAGLGTRLFERGRRGVMLTPAGAQLYDYAQAIFRLVAEAESAVTDVANLAAGQLAVGATPGVSVYLLPEPDPGVPQPLSQPECDGAHRHHPGDHGGPGPAVAWTWG